MKTVEIEIYTIDELSQSAIQKAYHNWLEVQEPFYDFEIDTITDDAKQFGIDIDKIYFTGFSCQGDGAMFEGRYQYNPQWRDMTKDDTFDEYLIELGSKLEKLYNQYGDMIATIKHDNSRYYHENTADISVNLGEDEDIYDDGTEALTEVLRGFMRWAYRRLESEYDYQCSMEYFMDTARDYDNHYTEDGNLFDE